MKVEEFRVGQVISGIDFNMLSLLEDNTTSNKLNIDGTFVNQVPDSLSIHKPTKKWSLITSDVGYFNKFTNFICGDVSSILFMDVNGELCSPTISEVIKNTKKYFMIYPLPLNNIDCQNTEVEFSWKSSRFNRVTTKTEIVKLDFNLGLKIGKNFFNSDINYPLNLSKFEQAINGSNEENLFWPNKNLVINSNPEFILGIIFSYLKSSQNIFGKPEESLKETLYVNKTNNTYIFSTMLNWLGAAYSFQNIPLIKMGEYETQMKIHLALPHSLSKTFKNIIKSYPEFEDFKKLFKSKEWYLVHLGNKVKIRKMQIGTKDKTKSNYNTLIDSGKIRLIPMSAFKFNEIKSNLTMYDFTMPRADATNYAPTFCPVLKNSDGDILTMSAIYGKEAIEDAKAFEPSHKEWFRNLNDGEINNYIADDAILGLFAATKFLGK